MGILDIFFKREKKPELEEPDEFLPSEQIQLYEGEIACDHCRDKIKHSDKRVKFSGKKYHRKCFKKMKKDARKVAFG